MKYNIILLLRSGEYISLFDIVSISWSRARMIFVTDDDRSHVYYRGDIIKLDMEVSEND